MMHVLWHCSTPALTACAATSHLLQSLVSRELRRRYFTVLRWFFADRVHDFHSILAPYGAIISGSTALAFLSWTDTWSPGDLDVYLPDNTFSAFVDELCKHQLACADVDFGFRPHSTYHGINTVRRYYTPTGARMDVIQSNTQNAASLLLYFWSSLVVNVLTPRGAVCAFPSLTLHHKGLVADISHTKKAIEARIKYETRGFEFKDITSWLPSAESDSHGHRIFSDGTILVLNFQSVWSKDPSDLPIIFAGCLWVLR